jgi:hypothetical protein
MQLQKRKGKLNLSITPIEIFYWMTSAIRSYDCCNQFELKYEKQVGCIE